MTETATAAGASMNSSDNFALWRSRTAATDTMTGLTGTDPGHGLIALEMGLMLIDTAGMTIKTSNLRPSHQDIIDRGIARTDIRGPRRVMTLTTAGFMQGQNTVGARPAIGEQRIRTAGPTPPMTFVTSLAWERGKLGSAREIVCPHQKQMVRALAASMAVKIGNMTIGALMWCGLVCRNSS